MKEIDEKKKKVAKKMKGTAMSGGDRGDIVEGVEKGQHFKPQDRFTRKDIKKEKADWRKKNSNLEKGGDFNT